MPNYSVYPNFEEGDIGVYGWSQLGDGVDLLGKHGAELVVKGICLVVIIRLNVNKDQIYTTDFSRRNC